MFEMILQVLIAVFLSGVILTSIVGTFWLGFSLRSGRLIRPKDIAIPGITLSMRDSEIFIKACNDARDTSLRTEEMIQMATCYEDIGSAMLVMAADEEGKVMICSYEGRHEVTAPTFRQALSDYLDVSGRRE